MYSITWYGFSLYPQSIVEKSITALCCYNLILKQTICLDIRANISRKQSRSRDFFRDVNRSIARHSRHLSSFLSSKKTPENIYIYIWFPASHPAVTWALRHPRLLSKNKRSKETVRGAVATWLVCSTPERVAQVRALAGTLCCVLGQDTLLSQCFPPPRCINEYGGT